MRDGLISNKDWEEVKEEQLKNIFPIDKTDQNDEDVKRLAGIYNSDYVDEVHIRTYIET